MYGRFPHMLILHAVLDQDVSLEDVARSRRVDSPSGSVGWSSPDRREWAVLWNPTDYRGLSVMCRYPPDSTTPSKRRGGGIENDCVQIVTKTQMSTPH